MANTYTSMFVHVVYATKYRKASIAPFWKTNLMKFTTIVIEKLGQQVVRINCVENHVHILIRMNTKMTVADMMRDTKSVTSRFVNENCYTPVKFEWQSGYGSFSVSPRDVEMIKAYIDKQEEHHKNLNLRQEYIALLKENGVEFDEQYLFAEPIDPA